MTIREKLEAAKGAQIASDRHGHESTKHLRVYLDRMLELVESIVDGSTKGFAAPKPSLKGEEKLSKAPAATES